MGKKLSLIAVILYMLLAHIGGHFLKIHWIHIFNSFMLFCILHNLLEWKFDCMIEEENEKDEEENNTDETLNN